MLKKLFFNKTFSIGPVIELNACVGTNGVQDLEKYGFGYDEAVRLLFKAAKRYYITADAVIYPLVFCARHRIELFLKDQLMKFPLIRENVIISENTLTKTHNLYALWDLFKNHGMATDRRILGFIDKAEEYVKDFAEIDPTGETFRYPHDKYKSLHLKNISIINIRILEKRYLNLSKLIENVGELTKYLIEEYEQKTFTNELSRKDIEDISQILPAKNEWTQDAFEITKSEIRDKFNLSNRKLSRAIDIIKGHRKYCTNIGLEMPISHLDGSSLKKYLVIYSRLQGKRINTRQADSKQIRAYKKTKSRYIREIKSKLTRQNIICIFTLIELGKLAYFSEEFDSLYAGFEKEAENEYVFMQFCSTISTNGAALLRLKNGLTKIGQKTLLKVIDTPKKGQCLKVK